MPQPASYVRDVVEAMSIKYNNRVYEAKRGGRDVIVMSLGEAFFDIPLWPFDGLPMPDVYHYSHSRGIPELRELVADLYGNRYGVAVDPATELIVTAGSKLALHMAFMAILGPGDEVLIQEPAWVSYPEQVRLCHGHPVQIPCGTTVDAYRGFVTERTRAVVVNSPHNPSGRALTAAEWEQVYRLAEEFDLYVVSDEAYSDFLLEPERFHSAARFDTVKARTVVCNSLSKNCGMSGWRLGYLVTNADLAGEILKVNQHLVTCPATILQWYLVRHLHQILEVTRPQIRAVVLKRRAVAQMLDSLGLEYMAGEGTFYLFVSIEDSALRSEEFCDRLLDEAGVSAVPGIGYGPSCDRYIRISIGAESMERVRTAVQRIADLVRQTAARPSAGVSRPEIRELPREPASRRAPGDGTRPRGAGRAPLRRVIGILGGMGPAATLDLQREILRLTPAERDQDHIEVLVYSNPKIPDRSSAILDGGEDPLPYLVHTARVLERSGAGLLVMPCNAAHHFLDGLRQAVQVAIVDMVWETCAEVKARFPGARRVGLLAATGTVRSGTYTRCLAEHGIEVVAPSAADQERVQAAILETKAGRGHPATRASLESVAGRLVSRGAEAVVLGCTEVPLALGDSVLPCPTINSTRASARAAVDWALGRRG